MYNPIINIYRNPFDISDVETKTIVNEKTVIDVLIGFFPKGFLEEGSARVYLNTERVKDEDYTLTMKKGDVIDVLITPKDPVTIIVTVVATIVGVVIANNAMKNIPTVDTPESLSSVATTNSSNYNLNLQANLARLGEPIPSVYGRTNWYPDLASAPYIFYRNNIPVTRHVLCLGQGTFDLEELNLGNTSILYNEGVTYELYNPNEPMTLFNDNVLTLQEIQGAAIQSREHTSRTRFCVYDKPNRTLTANYITEGDNPYYENTFSVGETVRILTNDDTVTGEYIIESIIEGTQTGGGLPDIFNAIVFENTDDWPDIINTGGLVLGYDGLRSSVTSFTQLEINATYTDVPLVNVTGGGQGGEVTITISFLQNLFLTQYYLVITTSKQGIGYNTGDTLRATVGNLVVNITLQQQDTADVIDTTVCRVKEYISNVDSDIIPLDLPWNFKHFIEPEYSGTFSVGVEYLKNVLIDMDFEFSRGYYNEIIPEGESYAPITDILSTYYFIFWYIDSLTGSNKDMYIKYGIPVISGSVPNGFTMFNLTSFTFSITPSGTATPNIPWANVDTLTDIGTVSDTFDTGGTINLYLLDLGVWVDLTGFITDIDYTSGTITVSNTTPYDLTQEKIVTGIIVKQLSSYIVKGAIESASTAYTRVTASNKVTTDSDDYTTWGTTSSGIYYTHGKPYDKNMSLKGYHVEDPYKNFNAINSATYADKGIITRVKSIKEDIINYPPVTLLAIEFIADKSVSYDVDNKYNVTATRRLSKWNGVYWENPTPTRSIAWVIADIWMASYGASRSYKELDLDRLVDLDNLWESRGDTFNGVFDAFVTIWEAISKVARVGRAKPIFDGASLTVVRDSKIDTYTTLFNTSNMVKNSFNINYLLDNNQSPNGVSIKYLDEDNGYVQSTVLSDPSVTRPFTVDFFGCVSYKEAWKEAQYLAAQLRYQKYKVSFEVELIGNIPVYGDLVKVQHDMPNWGSSGRVTSKEGLSLTVSEPLTFETNSVHYMSFTTPKGGLSGPHIVTEGINSTTVTLETDVTDFTFITELTDKIPTSYTFGPVTNWSKSCTVLSITPTSNNEKFKIEVTPYFEEVHTADEGVIPDKTDITDTFNIVPPVVAGLILSNEPGSGVINVVWNPVFDIDNYVIEQSIDNITWTNTTYPTTPNTNITYIGALYVRAATEKNTIISNYTSQSIVST